MGAAASMQRAEEVLTGFPGALREAGLSVDPQRTATFLAAARSLPLHGLADLARAGRVTLVGSREDFPTYEAVFAAWFANDPLPEIVESPDEEQAPPANRRRDAERPREILDGEASGKQASPDEALGRKAFASLGEAERIALAGIRRDRRAGLRSGGARRRPGLGGDPRAVGDRPGRGGRPGSPTASRRPTRCRRGGRSPRRRPARATCSAPCP
jgi:uncharacterized protein with von Willebrand factor type A (vWA) domain